MLKFSSISDAERLPAAPVGRGKGLVSAGSDCVVKTVRGRCARDSLRPSDYRDSDKEILVDCSHL